VFEGDDLSAGSNTSNSSRPASPRRENADGRHYFYGNYYAVQAMFLAGGDYWAKWYPAIREHSSASRTRPARGKISSARTMVQRWP
jgi:hypothetical protein